MKKIVYVITVLLSLNSYITAEDFGANGALSSENFDIETMLEYAIEDEYLALTEYEALINEFGLSRPYSNIAESEKTHIQYLEAIYKDYNMDIPEVNTTDYLYIPGNLSEAAQIGVEAEILNIDMYEKFLKEDLPSDIREVFEFLKRASENHLRAFQRQLDSPQGRG